MDIAGKFKVYLRNKKNNKTILVFLKKKKKTFPIVTLPLNNLLIMFP